MARLDEIGEQDGWRCWICDESVDPTMSVNDPRGPSIDSMTTRSKSKSKGASPIFGEERLAHRSCNTKKGAIAPVIEWSDTLFVADPAPIVAVVERLHRKAGREIVGRCPTEDDAREAGEWLLDRLGRLIPDLALSTQIEPGGGQFMLVLRTA